MQTSPTRGSTAQAVPPGMLCPRPPGHSIVCRVQIGAPQITIGAQFLGVMLVTLVQLASWTQHFMDLVRSFTATIPACLHLDAAEILLTHSVPSTRRTMAGRQRKTVQIAGQTFAPASIKGWHCRKISTQTFPLLSLADIRPCATLQFTVLLVRHGTLCQRHLSHLFVHQAWIGPPKASIGAPSAGAMLMPAVWLDCQAGPLLAPRHISATMLVATRLTATQTLTTIQNAHMILTDQAPMRCTKGGSVHVPIRVLNYLLKFTTTFPWVLQVHTQA